MKLFGLLLALIGLALIIVGQRMFWIRQLARLRGSVLDGQIVKWRRIRIENRGHSESSASRSMFCAVVSFTDPAGVERTRELGYQHTPRYRDEHPVGSSHQVLFDPKHPDRPLDTTWTTAWFLPALLTSCGLLVTLIGLGVLFGS